jgi:hypothetical protein
MGMISHMPVPPLASLILTMTNKYVNSVDEKGRDIGVPQSPIGIGKFGI